MISRVIQRFFPDLNDHETKKFGLLSLSFFTIIGVYWLMRLLKDTVMYKIAFPVELGWACGHGRMMQPLAKSLSPLMIIVVILIYSKLIDRYKKQTLFYIICTGYAIFFAAIGILLGIKLTMGSACLGKTVLASTGWLVYLGTESFGSLIITLFWSFVVSISTNDEAKKGFPLIIAGGQLGAIIGSALNLFTEQLGGTWILFIIAALAISIIIPLIRHFMKVIPENELIGNVKAHKSEDRKEGFIEGFMTGIQLLFTEPYLVGILTISTIYDIASQIMDYQMHSLADVSPFFHGEVGFSQFQGIYGITTNSLSFLIALLGTGFLFRKFGVRRCLLIYPLVFAAIVLSFLGLYTNFDLSIHQLLFMSLGAMIIIKTVSFTINNPAKDILYIPTSRDARFKTKGWIDMFGSRTTKMFGSRITDFLKYNFSDLIVYGSLISLGVIGFWIIAAILVGKKNEKLVATGEIIE
ncbi:hypothetical protein HOM50_01080 [bacterium]|nr:hypothetical protein [bacterium]MBT5014984.1 hypothetical protein [bacterium]